MGGKQIERYFLSRDLSTLPFNSTAPVKLTSDMKHGLSKCLVVIQFLSPLN